MFFISRYWIAILDWAILFCPLHFYFSSIAPPHRGMQVTTSPLITPCGTWNPIHGCHGYRHC